MDGRAYDSICVYLSAVVDRVWHKGYTYMPEFVQGSVFEGETRCSSTGTHPLSDNIDDLVLGA